MKTIKKLTLKKETVASLESNEMNSLRGGTGTSGAVNTMGCNFPTSNCAVTYDTINGYFINNTGCASVNCHQPPSQKFDKYGRKIC